MWTDGGFHRGEELAGFDPERRSQGGDVPNPGVDLQFDREGLVACPAGRRLLYTDTMSNDSRPTLAGVVLAAVRAATAVAKDSSSMHGPHEAASPVTGRTHGRTRGHPKGFEGGLHGLPVPRPDGLHEGRVGGLRHEEEFRGFDAQRLGQGDDRSEGGSSQPRFQLRNVWHRHASTHGQPCCAHGRAVGFSKNPQPTPEVLAERCIYGDPGHVRRTVDVGGGRDLA